MEEYFRISKAARELKRSTDWLRDAEISGRIPMARRDLNGWRVYTQKDLELLRELIVPQHQHEGY